MDDLRARFGGLVKAHRLRLKMTQEALAARANISTDMVSKIEGGNSALFYAAGRVHPALRTALLAREFLTKRGAAITVRLDPFSSSCSVKPSGERSPVDARLKPSRHVDRKNGSVVSGFSRTVAAVRS